MGIWFCWIRAWKDILRRGRRYFLRGLEGCGHCSDREYPVQNKSQKWVCCHKRHLFGSGMGRFEKLHLIIFKNFVLKNIIFFIFNQELF